MKRNDLVKEEVHEVFKREMFQESKVYRLVNERESRELFVGILTRWIPGEIRFVVSSDSYFVKCYDSLIEKRIDNSLAIIKFSPGFLKDNYALELLR